MSYLKNLYISNNKIVIDFPGGLGSKTIAHLSFITPQRLIERLIYRRTHPNRHELNAFISSLRKYCKKVIITDYRYGGKDIKADLTIGFGFGFNASSKYRSYSIYYATGSSFRFQTDSVLMEINYLAEKISMPIENYFRFPEYDSTDIERESDKIYLIGNEKTSKTFNVNSSKISLLPGIALGNSGLNLMLPRGMIFRDKILWMGSKGFLHKGLHIAAEVAFNLGLKLIIVGVRDEEKTHVLELLRLIKCEYVMHPWVDINSNEWLSIISDVTFCIGCSVSEGMSTSLLTCCSFGLIPISTDTCGIDEGFIIPFFPRVDLVERLTCAVSNCLNKTDIELAELRGLILASSRRSYSVSSFGNALDNNLMGDIGLDLL